MLRNTWFSMARCEIRQKEEEEEEITSVNPCSTLSSAWFFNVVNTFYFSLSSLITLIKCMPYENWESYSRLPYLYSVLNKRKLHSLFLIESKHNPKEKNIDEIIFFDGICKHLCFMTNKHVDMFPKENNGNDQCQRGVNTLLSFFLFAEDQTTSIHYEFIFDIVVHVAIRLVQEDTCKQRNNE